MSNFENIITFYLNTISDFLLSEPIIYFTGALVSLFVIKIIKSLCNIK